MVVAAGVAEVVVVGVARREAGGEGRAGVAG